jgi:hypothetical protein
MKTINFLGYTISPSDLQDLSENALSKIQQRASWLYGHERGYTVAQAWVEAVLEHLYQECLSKNLNKQGGSHE